MSESPTPPLQNLSDLEAALATAGVDVPSHGAICGKIRTFFRRYTDLERLLLSEVPLHFPSHLLDSGLPTDPLEAGEVLADRERERLELGDHEVGGLYDLLDRQGLKLYRPPFPEGSPVEGLFLFDREAGPAFILDGRLPATAADHALARLYGHFLVDNDPYRIRVLVSGRPAAEPAALRAEAFATAFLVSRAGIEDYLKALGVRAGAVLEADTARHLAVYFEVDSRTLTSRLLGLGYLAADRVEAFLAELDENPPPAVSPLEGDAIPERFVRLALEAHARGAFDLEALARHLETDLDGAEELAGRFVLEPEADAEAESGSEGGAGDASDGEIQ